MLTIDGSDGGGQVLRTALSLATVTDTPVRVEGVRANRPSPGLKPQHLAAVELLAEYSDAAVEGAAVGATALTVRPGDDHRTSLSVDVGTAGSVTLLFDAVLPVAATIDESTTVTATGGTDVKWAPTVAYYQGVKLPLLSRCGVAADVTLDRTGFYPAGGGEATLRTRPSSRSALHLEDRGALERVELYSKASEDLEARNVADRQANHAVERLEASAVPVDVRNVEYVPAPSPGSSLLLRAVYGDSLAGFAELGERGRTSEAVADGAVDRFEEFQSVDAPVDRHMADQVTVFLALVGGTVRIPAVTDHVWTNLEVLAAFGSDVALDDRDDGTHVLTASSLLASR